MGKKYPRTVNGVLDALLDFVFDETLDESGAKILSAKARAAGVALQAIEMIAANQVAQAPAMGDRARQLQMVKTVRVLPQGIAREAIYESQSTDRKEQSPAEIVSPPAATG